MELKIHRGKLRHQELLDGLHTLALIEVFPLHRDYSGQLQVAGYVFVQLHPGRPGARGDYLGWVNGKQLGQGAEIGRAVPELTEHDHGVGQTDGGYPHLPLGRSSALQYGSKAGGVWVC